MRNLVFVVGILSCISIPLFAQKNIPAVGHEPIINSLDIGGDIPLANMELLAVPPVGTERLVTLQNTMTAKGLIVMFSCNKCPFVKNAQMHTTEIISYAKERKIGMIIINSNEASRKEGESERDMIEYASRNNYTIPYVIDIGSKLADFFGAVNNPEVFLFNGEGKLVYKGAIEDNPSDPSKSIHFYLREAADVMLSGGRYNPSVTKSVGCSIKRKQ